MTTDGECVAGAISREAAVAIIKIYSINQSWRGPVWASAPLGLSLRLRRGARANPVGVVVVIALVVVASSLTCII